eukprot:TRINITY_DN12336_c0_g1_i1.p1 TRINITY_DN12336_c0_g1~~TRINITY_DN12336_c0_g1_i1.p1  ORF type:complete len:286 (+),score=47.25 TRINITY_DN12336_c0_g1_i1:67-924(+)
MPSSSKRIQPLLQKTKMCSFHLTSKCTRGEACTWAHSEAELCAVPDLSCTRMCKQLKMKGRCDNPDCMFAHSKQELRKVRVNTHGGGSPQHDFSKSVFTTPVPPITTSSDMPSLALRLVDCGRTTDSELVNLPAGAVAYSVTASNKPGPPPGLEDCCSTASSDTLGMTPGLEERDGAPDANSFTWNAAARCGTSLKPPPGPGLKNMEPAYIPVNMAYARWVGRSPANFEDAAGVVDVCGAGAVRELVFDLAGFAPDAPPISKDFIFHPGLARPIGEHEAGMLDLC